jgi:thymidylate synthase
MEITVRNVNQAFSEVFWKLKAANLQPEQTRNGPALVFPEPVTTTYLRPTERVLFHAGRDANPIFHLMEAIWMLAGRNDVAFLEQFNRTIGQYSDNGEVFNAAYGHRWRKHFGHDQLIEVINILRADPKSRQAVIQMWDDKDLTKQTKDKACNTQVVFSIRGDFFLDMTVFNRSNDIWWGAYGANAVHFSVLQEFVATSVGMQVGVYRQISNNLHLYTELYDAKKYVNSPPNAHVYDHYSNYLVKPLPLMLDGHYQSFLWDAEEFCTKPFNDKIVYRHPFFQGVAVPMATVSAMRRGKVTDGRGYASKIKAPDWKNATLQWINNREAKKQSKV